MRPGVGSVASSGAGFDFLRAVRRKRRVLHGIDEREHAFAGGRTHVRELGERDQHAHARGLAPELRGLREHLGGDLRKNLARERQFLLRVQERLVGSQKVLDVAIGIRLRCVTRFASGGMLEMAEQHGLLVRERGLGDAVLRHALELGEHGLQRTLETVGKRDELRAHDLERPHESALSRAPR